MIEGPDPYSILDIVSHVNYRQELDKILDEEDISIISDLISAPVDS